MTFPTGFVWGAATAAYQVEGSPLADGAGPSIWHDFAHTPGRVERDENGDVACDHYHRYREDVALIKAMHLQAYRFSISWARVLPDGVGRVNAAGLGFYDRLVDELLAAGIEPFVTLYHWDLPSALEERGGWANRDVPEWFGEYSSTVYGHLGDRVRHWITLNEPFVTAHFGYVAGMHAPGIRDMPTALRVAHHLMLAHGAAVEAHRAAGSGSVGITLSLGLRTPAHDTEESRGAAALSQGYMNELFLDPIFGRGYPALLVDHFGPQFPKITDGDLRRVAQPIDFLGVNYYNGSLVEATADDSPFPARTVPTSELLTELGWPLDPQGLRDLLVWIAATYGNVPVYITENGAAFPDTVDADGAVHDQARVDFFRSHVGAAERALADGVDLRGYFAWSLLDNFEWSSGYRPRFGLVRVDYDTQQRTIKDSGHFWSSVIAANGLPEPKAESATMVLPPAAEEVR